MRLGSRWCNGMGSSEHEDLDTWKTGGGNERCELLK